MTTMKMIGFTMIIDNPSLISIQSNDQWYQVNYCTTFLNEDCKQYFPRLFFKSDSYIYSTSSSDTQTKMIIKFNTNSPCIRSYVTVQQLNKIGKFYCQSYSMIITQNKTFIQYIQNCEVVIKNNQNMFNYTCYGSTGKLDHKIIKNTQSYSVNIPHSSQSLNIVTVADWGPIRVRNYTPLYPTFKKMRESSDKYVIHALAIVGDIAYDLNSNDCQAFLIFMQELSAISPYWPIIPTFGNHEGQGFSREILIKNFQVPELSGENRVQAFTFWNLRLITFNPYSEIYSKSNPESYQKMSTSLLQNVNIPSDFTIVFSHYPLICSQIDDRHCGDTLKTMPDLFQKMSSSGKVDLYLGAHMHQYERVYPYVNGEFQPGIESPYDRGMMPSVVNGIAGCDIGIIDQDYKTQDFSAFHMWNKTGFGLLAFTGFNQNKIKLKYQEVITDPQLKIIDQFIIQNKSANRKQKLRIAEE